MVSKATIKFSDENEERLEELTYAIKDYDMKAYGKEFVTDEERKGIHGKYARSKVLSDLIDNGSDLYVKHIIAKTQEKADNERRGTFTNKERPPKEEDKQEAHFMKTFLSNILK